MFTASKTCSNLLRHAIYCTTDDEQEHVLQSLVALLHSITHKVSRRYKQYIKLIMYDLEVYMHLQLQGPYLQFEHKPCWPSVCRLWLILPSWWSLQGEARVAYWCLSRQTLQPHVLQQHRADLVTAIALGLVSSNKWKSMQCVFHSLRCIARLAHQVPEALRECATLWLPQLWCLLLVQPVTDYEQVHSYPTVLQLIS